MINIHTIDFEFYENKAVLPMNRTMGNVMTGNNFFFLLKAVKHFSQWYCFTNFMEMFIHVGNINSLM